MSLTLRLNLIVSFLLIAIFIAVFFNILYTTADDVRQEVVSNFELSKQMADAKIKVLRTVPIEIIRPYPYVDVTAEQKIHLLKLESFNSIKYVKIELFDENNELIVVNKNHGDLNDSSLQIPGRIKRFLQVAFFNKSERAEYLIEHGGLQLGKLVIGTNAETELRDLWYQTLSTLMPVAILFFIVSLAMTFIISTVIKPVVEFVRVVNREQQSGASHAAGTFRIRHLLRIPAHLQGIRHELQHSSKKVHELNNRILDLQEEERRRISAELHDELGQHLTAIRFEAELIRTAKNIEEAQQSAEAIDGIGRTMKDIVRSMLERLRPADIDTLGLQGALAELIATWQLRHPYTEISFDCQADFSTMPDAKQLTIYRILQEGLTNISRHAGATADKVSITIQTDNDQISISLIDNGVGCDLSVQVNGFGLKGMSERVDSLSGQLTLVSSPGRGMKIFVDIPIEGAEENE